MVVKFDVYTDHYALQWLKMMCMGSALFHHWDAAALKDYDFVIKNTTGKIQKIQTPVDGLSRLPVESPSSTHSLLHLCTLDGEDEAGRATQELHATTHLRG